MKSQLRQRRFWLLMGGLWLLIVIGLLLRIVGAISSQHDYDIDIDTYFYLGWRFREGGLMYLESFNAKWPLVAMVFAPISQLGSIGAYRILVLLMDLCTGLLLGWSLARLRERGWMPNHLQWPILPATAALTLLMSQKMIGGLSGHLHHTANLFTALALSAAVLGMKSQPRWRQLSLLGCGFWLMAAVSMRPNLVLPLGLSVIATVLLTGRPARIPGRMRSLLPLGLGAVMLIGVMAIPYIHKPDGLTRLWAGAMVLPWEWRQHTSGTLNRDSSLLQELGRILNNRVAGLHVWTLAIMPITLLGCQGWMAWHARPRAARQFLVPAVSLFNLLGLAWSFQLTHYWAHYEMMTILPTATLIVCGIGAIPSSCNSRPAAILRSLSFISIGAITLVLVLNVFVAEARSLGGPPSRRQIDRQIILNFIQQQPPGQRGFSSPQDFSFHWRLKQPSSTIGIHRSWSMRPYDMPASWATTLLGIATDRKDACDQLAAEQNRFVIWERQERADLPDVDQLMTCLEHSGETWINRTKEIGLKNSDYIVMERER